jgi:hypothetical protein
MDILDKQRKLLASFGRLDKRYGMLQKPSLQGRTEVFEIDLDRLPKNGSPMSESSRQAVQFPPAEELIEKALQWLKVSRGETKRIEWVAWDPKMMQNLIAELSGYNDKMHDSLNKDQKDTLLDMQTRTSYQIVLLNRQMENLVQIWQSGCIPYQPQGGEYPDYGFLKGSCHRSFLGALAQQKFVHLAIEGSQDVSEELGKSIGLLNLAVNIRGVELNLDNIQTIDGESFPDRIIVGDRTEAIHNGASVWIEWKPNEVAGLGMPDGQVNPKTRSCVQKLAAMLHRDNRKVEFCAPYCRGYFVHESKDRDSHFGLVFEKPPTVQASTSPITLRQLIERSNRQSSIFDTPSLTDRIKLMSLLAETIERLHAVDCLHKGLRSANILFFLEDGAKVESSLSDPYISGFDYSRPATSDDMTAWADVYRHPTVQSTGNRADSSYNKSSDLYSLGIVLLEIGHWKTIDQILSIDLNTAGPEQTELVMQRLLTKELRHVKSYVGNTVEEVVRACLVGPEAFGLKNGCDERSGAAAVASGNALWEIVRKLENIEGL